MQAVNLSEFNMLLAHRHLSPRNRKKWLYTCDKCDAFPVKGSYVCITHGKTKYYCLFCCFSKYGYYCSCEDPEEIKRLKKQVTPEKDVVAEANKRVRLSNDNPLKNIASEELLSVVEVSLNPISTTEESEKAKEGKAGSTYAVYIPNVEKQQN